MTRINYKRNCERLLEEIDMTISWVRKIRTINSRVDALELRMLMLKNDMVE